MTKFYTISLLITLFVSPVASAQADDPVAARFMFYNVENLFDIHDDSLRDDNEFLPEGERRWTLSRYRSKILSLYKVIIAAGNPEPPVLVGFCEVENRSVLKDLTNTTGLRGFNYSIVHENSDDPRGIDVALIYRPEKVKLLSYCYLYPPDLTTTNVATRSILYCRLILNGDTLHVVLNHWPSRRGGVLAGEESRRIISEYVRELADSIAESCDGRAGIIISGDFNATPSDNAILRMVSGSGVGKNAPLVNLSGQREMVNRGTYKYRGTWEMIDQVIVSQYLLENRDGIYTGFQLFRIVDSQFLLERDDTYPGMKPYATYGGYSYRGGFSDHLPVIIDLKTR